MSPQKKIKTREGGVLGLFEGEEEKEEVVVVVVEEEEDVVVVEKEGDGKKEVGGGKKGSPAKGLKRFFSSSVKK